MHLLHIAMVAHCLKNGDLTINGKKSRICYKETKQMILLWGTEV